MMHSPFQIPPVSEKDSGFVENLPNFTFSEKNSIFIRQNFLRPFLVIDHKFEISLRVLYILLCFSFPPTLTMMHLCITQCRTGRPWKLIYRDTCNHGWRPRGDWGTVS